MDVLARLDATVGECPVYDAADDVLYSVDIPAGRLWRCPRTARPNTSTSAGRSGASPSSRAGASSSARGPASPPWRRGTPRAGLGHARAGPPDTVQRRPVRPHGPLRRRHRDHRSVGAGALYLVDHDGTAPARRRRRHVQRHRLEPRRPRRYYADSIAGTVTRYHGTATSGASVPDRRRRARPRRGLPDGLTVDDEGTIWLAVWGAGEVRRFDHAGGPSRPSACPRPRDELRVRRPRAQPLFVTTARAGVPPDDPG